MNKLIVTLLALALLLSCLSALAETERAPMVFSETGISIDFEDVLDRARLNEDNLKYIDCAMEIYEEHIDDIDASIRSHLNRWTIDRISKVNLSILRLAVAEMKYMDDITPGVSVNEAVELTKKYSDEESSGFVNGILRSISRDIK